MDLDGLEVSMTRFQFLARFPAPTNGKYAPKVITFCASSSLIFCDVWLLSSPKFGLYAFLEKLFMAISRSIYVDFHSISAVVAARIIAEILKLIAYNIRLKRIPKNPEIRY